MTHGAIQLSSTKPNVNPAMALSVSTGKDTMQLNAYTTTLRLPPVAAPQPHPISHQASEKPGMTQAEIRRLVLELIG